MIAKKKPAPKPPFKPAKPPAKPGKAAASDPGPELVFDDPHYEAPPAVAHQSSPDYTDHLEDIASRLADLVDEAKLQTTALESIASSLKTYLEEVEEDEDEDDEGDQDKEDPAEDPEEETPISAA